MGYLNGYTDREFIEELPRFRLPMLSGGGTYRAFEISDDSMLPSVGRGTTIIGRYVEDWHTIKGGTPCIVVSQRAGILFRRVVADGAFIKLSADNAECASEPLTDVLEIWEAKSYISSTFPVGNPSLENLASMVLDLTQQVKKMQSERG